MREAGLEKSYTLAARQARFKKELWKGKVKEEQKDEKKELTRKDSASALFLLLRSMSPYEGRCINDRS